VSQWAAKSFGLVPKKAIEMARNFFLQLENFSPAQVFENRLRMR